MESIENTVKFLDRAKQDLLKYDQTKSSFWRARRVMENREKMVNTIRNEIKNAEKEKDDKNLIICYMMTDCYLERSIQEERAANPNKQDFSLLRTLIRNTLYALTNGELTCEKFKITDFAPLKVIIDKEINGLRHMKDLEIRRLNESVESERREKIELSNKILQNEYQMQNLARQIEIENMKIKDLKEEKQNEISQMIAEKNKQIKQLQEENEKSKSRELVLEETNKININKITDMKRVSTVNNKLNQVEAVNTVIVNDEREAALSNIPMSTRSDQSCCSK